MAQVIKLKNSSGTTLPSSLEYGELGVMYGVGNEKIVFKNSSGTIAPINDWSKILNKPNLVTTDTNQTITGKKVFQNVDGVSISNGTNTVTLSIDSNGKLKVDGDIYSTGEVSAYGSGTGSGGGSGLISTVYDSTGLGGTYLDTDYSNTFNAYTVNKINNDLNSSLQRISSLEGGSATSINTTGTGNVITNISKSGSTLNITKASTAILEGDSRLTDSRKNPYTLTFSGYNTSSYDGSANVTVPIPSKVSQLTNDSAFLTAITKSQVEGVLTGNITSHTHSQYLTGNQNITLSGDITGSGTTGIVTSLKNVGTAGTYRSVTTDAQGRVTAGTNPTTLAGYGITDALPSSGGTISGNLTLTGNLTLNGSTTTINSTVTTLDDPILTLGGDTAPATNDGKDRGLEFRWHNGTTSKVGFFGYDSSTGYLSFIPDATNTSEVFSGTLGDIAATNFRGNLVGNADSATKLSSAKTISLTGDITGSVSTDLSGAVSIATTIAANSVVLGTDTTGNYAGTIAVSGTGLSLSGVAGEGTAYTITSNATNANTASTIVARDGSGNFSAGTITAALSGNSSTATKLQTARTIAISGDVTGTATSFDGSGNISITSTISVIDGGTW